MLPTAQEFKAAALDEVFAMQTWAKDHFDLSNLPIKLTVSDARRNYYGQASVKRDKEERFQTFLIQISSHQVLRYEVQAVSEYASFNKSKVIGGFETNDWRVWLRTLVAHEMSHVIQYALRFAAFDAKAFGSDHSRVTGWNGATPVFGKMGPYESHHGNFFQHIYADFRRKWINPNIALSARTAPDSDFLIPDDFEERMLAMPKSGLEGIRFESNGRTIEVAGRNPKRNQLFNYVIRDADGVLRRCKLMLIAERSGEALARIKASPALRKEFLEHSEALQTKARANAKSSMVKRQQAARRA